MATFTTYDKTAGNLRRSVESTIMQISPEDTPAFSAAKKTVAEATLHEFQQDSLVAADADNAAVQGAAATFTNPTDVEVRSNRTQIFQKTAQVSGTLQAVKQYGIAQQLGYDIAQRGRELKRDIEAAMVGRDQAAVTGSTSTAAKMASVINQIDSSVTTATAAGGALTEAAILSAHEKTFTKGGDPSLLLTHPSQATNIAAFATAAGRNRDIEGTELYNAIDLIVSPFGELTVVIDRFMSADHALLVDPEYVSVATLRPLTTERLARDGDRESVQLLTEMTAYASHDEAHGMVTITA